MYLLFGRSNPLRKAGRMSLEHDDPTEEILEVEKYKRSQASPATKAREIAEEIVRESRQNRFANAVIWAEHLDQWITAALREYGEEQYQQGRTDELKQNGDFNKQADAEGYRRGVE